MSGDMEVTCEAVSAGREGVLLVDCREPGEWEVCRIDGAVLVPLGEIVGRAEEIADLAEGSGKRVVVYCHHGVRSLRAAGALRAAGIGDAASMAGGIDRWSLAIDAAVPRY